MILAQKTLKATRMYFQLLPDSSSLPQMSNYLLTRLLETTDVDTTAEDDTSKEDTEGNTDVLVAIATLELTDTDDELLVTELLKATDGDTTAEDESNTEDTDGNTDVLWSIDTLELTATDGELLLVRLLETTDWTPLLRMTPTQKILKAMPMYFDLLLDSSSLPQMMNYFSLGYLIQQLTLTPLQRMILAQKTWRQHGCTFNYCRTRAHCHRCRTTSH